LGSDAILMTGNLARIDFVESIQGNGIATEQSYGPLCCVGPGTGALTENRESFQRHRPTAIAESIIKNESEPNIDPTDTKSIKHLGRRSALRPRAE
jgi:hypothetical protein